MVFEAECFRLRSIVSFDERDVIMTKNKWFGTDGVRGVANEFPMTAEFAFRLGCAAAEIVCTDKKKVAIAKDTRISADMLEASLCAAFTAKGIDVIRLGVIPTPTVTAFADTLGVDMALMITASHNPYYDNGIKLIAPNGDKFSDETTAELETLIEKNDFSFDKNKIGKITENFSIVEKYMQQAINLFGNVKLNGMKIVVDCANGCFSNILPEVLRQAGAEVVAIGVSPDGYNINKDCGSQHVEAMLEEVKNQRADLGIAVDGDGDRIKVCNEKGVLIKSDQLIAFLAKYLTSYYGSEVSDGKIVSYVKTLGSRDLGLSMSYRFKTDVPLNLIAGVFNGSGTNNPEWGKRVNLMGRIELGGDKGLQGSVAYYHGYSPQHVKVEEQNGTFVTEDFEQKLRMVGGELRYTRGGLLLEGEYARRYLCMEGATAMMATALVQGYYRFQLPKCPTIDYIAPIARWDMGNNVDYLNVQNKLRETFEANRITVGVNIGFGTKWIQSEIRLNYAIFCLLSYYYHLSNNNELGEELSFCTNLFKWGNREWMSG